MRSVRSSRTSRSATASTSASGPHSPASKLASPSRSSWRASRRGRSTTKERGSPRPRPFADTTRCRSSCRERLAVNDLLDAARSLRAVVEAEADATDRDTTLTPELVDAFAQSGLNHLQVPKELGGLEADVDTMLDVFEELAHQDGSVGWTFMANANATGMCSMFDRNIARQMLEGRPEVVCAGQFVSRGKARRVDGGFQVQGRFQFGSGSGRASWIGGGAPGGGGGGGGRRQEGGGAPGARLRLPPR